jgi:hypothetical protein
MATTTVTVTTVTVENRARGRNQEENRTRQCYNTRFTKERNKKNMKMIQYTKKTLIKHKVEGITTIFFEMITNNVKDVTRTIMILYTSGSNSNSGSGSEMMIVFFFA